MGTWCVVWACGVGSWCMWDVQVEEGLLSKTCDTLRNNGLYVVCGVDVLCGYVVGVGCAGGRRPSLRDVWHLTQQCLVCGYVVCGYVVCVGCAGGRRPSVRDV